MKRVSFEIAKELKEVGYPQIGDYWYSPKGIECYSQSDLDEIRYVSAPLYMEVWLWLWREKKLFIEIKIHFDSVKGYYNTAFIIGDNVCKHIETSDPEEAIIAAIDYLIENEIIKE